MLRILRDVEADISIQETRLGLLEEIERPIFDSSMRYKVKSEFNFGRFTHNRFLALLKRANQLDEVLKAHQSAIQK